MECKNTVWAKVNPAGPLSALWLLIGVICWFSAAPFVGESPELTAIAFAIGGIVVSAVDWAMRARSEAVEGVWRFYSSESGGSVNSIPVWVFGLLSAAVGVSYSMGLLPS